MWFFLFLGALVGAIAMGRPLWVRGREIERLEEERQTLVQEKQLVVDFMHHMVEALGETPSRGDLYQRIVHASILCTGALSACIFEKTERGTMRSIAVEGLFPPHRPLPEAVRGKLTTRAKFIEQILRAEEFPVGDGVVGQVAKSGLGELIEDALRDVRVVRHDDAALEVKSVIAVPLIFRERFFGVLAVTNPADGLPFNRTDFSLVQTLAEQAALALHNAELLHLQMERQQLDLDLSLASGIQQMLLPAQPPAVAGLEMDGRYMAAQKVGGDLYDLIGLAEGRLGVAVADVSGKGVAASLLMAICRTLLREIAPRHGSPAQVLVELNRALGADISRDLYITIIYAVFDPAGNRAVFARAGHELPLIGRRGVGVGGTYSGEFVQSEGMPIGLVPDELFAGVIQDREVEFAAGDVMVLYTDGITEAPNAEEKEFSGARLADAVRSAHERSASAINDAVLEAVRRFAGVTPQRDDITLVTVKRGR